MYRDHPLSNEAGISPFTLILNVLWLILGGAVAAIGWFLAAGLMIITIIGIPWARAAIDNGVYTLWPFGVRVMDRGAVYRDPPGPLSFLGNIIWLVLAGWWLALGHLASALVLAITIVGLPFAWAHVKLAGFALWPMGRTLTHHNFSGRSYRY